MVFVSNFNYLLPLLMYMNHTGSDRSPESIKNKITKLMGQYKEANERMNNTGDGLEGIEFTNFQDYIVNNICKYYFVLDPVLKDRPNVCPWCTNEDEVVLTTQNDTIVIDTSDSSDDESMVLSPQKNNQTNKSDKLNQDMLDQMITNNDNNNEYKRNDSIRSFSTVSTNNHLSTPSTLSDSSITNDESMEP